MTRDGEQNAPLIQFFYIPQQKVLKDEWKKLIAQGWRRTKPVWEDC